MKGLMTKLLTLFDDAKEEGDFDVTEVLKSLRSFHEFMKLNTGIRCPVISLTPDYNIYASWRGKQGRVFSVLFLPDGDVKFVIFRPNHKHPDKMIRLSGTATADVIGKLAIFCGVSDWI